MHQFIIYRIEIKQILNHVRYKGRLFFNFDTFGGRLSLKLLLLWEVPKQHVTFPRPYRSHLQLLR